MMERCLRATILICVLLSMCACSGSHGDSSGKMAENESEPAVGAMLRIAPDTERPQAQSGLSSPKTVAPFTFKPLRQYARTYGGSMADYEALLAGDFTGDGRTDLVAMPAHNQIDLFVQQADGTLAPPIILTYGGDSYTRNRIMVSNDFNEDGFMDVAFGTIADTGAAGGIGVLLSTGKGPPTYHIGYPDGSNVRDFATTLDVDGDGHHDLVAQDSEYTPHISGSECEAGCEGYTVLYGDGKGNFGRETFSKLGLPLGIGIAELDAEDLNEDGRPDLVMMLLGGHDEPGELRVAYRKTDGGLTMPVFVHSVDASSDHIVFGDLNGDGTDDSLVAPYDFQKRMQVRMRSLDGGFDPPLAIYHASLYPPLPLLADFDRNGRVDMLNHQFSGFDTTPFLALYLQAGGTLQAPIAFYDPPMSFGMKVSNHPLGYAAGDFNGDGCTDLAIAAGYDGVLVADGSNCLPQIRHLPDETMLRRISG